MCDPIKNKIYTAYAWQRTLSNTRLYPVSKKYAQPESWPPVRETACRLPDPQWCPPTFTGPDLNPNLLVFLRKEGDVRIYEWARTRIAHPEDAAPFFHFFVLFIALFILETNPFRIDWTAYRSAQEDRFRHASSSAWQMPGQNVSCAILVPFP